MIPADARSTIAAYLSGQPVAAADLRRACEVADADHEYRSFLLGELGLDRDWISQCATVREHLAELVGLTVERRVAEFPECVRHLDECTVCRAAYWTVDAPWKTVPSPSVAKVLAEGLRLVVGRAGELLERGLGFPAVSFEPVAAAMGLDDRLEQDPVDAVMAAAKEWVIPDPDAGLALRITARSLPSGDVAVTFGWEADAEFPTDPDARIEVSAAGEASPILAGSLAHVQPEPVILAPGSWSIRVSHRVGGKKRTWEVPFHLERGGDVVP